MSLPEVSNLIQATSGTPPSFPLPEVRVAKPHALDLQIELRNVHLELDELNARLLYARICQQSDVLSCQTLRRGLEAQQATYSQLTRNYKLKLEEYDRNNAKLQEDLRIADALIGSQKEVIDLYQGQQQQQPVSHLVQGGPLLSQCNEYNDSYQYPPYLPRSHEFTTDPASLRPVSDFSYSIEPPIKDSCDTISVTSKGGVESENPTPNLSIQSMLHPISADPYVPGSTNTKIEEMKRNEGERPSKKRKTKITIAADE